MCGIAGLIMLDPRATVDTERLIGMRDEIRHRGPDDAGHYACGPVGLGSRRLAIVDVANGHQPIANEDESLWIVFNGEIYNHPRLKRELERRGHRYRTRSDTETILHLYEEHGDACVERLQGMFAFALWDIRRQRLLLARDRLGIKPLYYARTDKELLFGSEIKVILRGGLAPSFNRHVLPEFLATRFVSGDETFFCGVRKLLPGRTLTWSAADGLQERQYWRLPLPATNGHRPRPRALEDEAGELKTRLGRAVQSHLMSDVPLGVFLSGGLDSSGLAAMMAPMVKAPLRTFAVGFDEREANELHYARIVARAIGAEHHETIVTPTQFFEALPKLVWHEDEPIAFPSSVPLYFVSRLARRHVKVVLTGEGADELFLGYNRYRVTAWNTRFSNAYSAITTDGMRKQIRLGVAGLPRALRRYAERSFLGVDSGPRSLFCENFAVFSEPVQRLVLDGDAARANGHDPYREVLRGYEEGGGDLLDRMSRADLQTYLVELLMKQDQMSMAASVESRVPFLDHELVEHVAAIPARHKLRGWQTKAVLRAAFKDIVPPAILTRRKMGFPTPVGQWLRESFRPMVDEFVLSARTLERGLFKPEAIRQLTAEHRTGARNHGDKLWLLVNLEIWHRVFLEQEAPDAVLEPAYACEFSG